MGRGRWAFGLSFAGFAWGLALIAASFVVPVYSGFSESAGSTGQITRSYSSATLVHEDGLRVLIPLAIPAVLAALVWFALHRRCSRGSRLGGPIAWSVVTLLGLFSLATALTVGMFVLPIVVLLGIAAALTPLPPADAQ
jgi:hypothetical protein